MGRVVRILLAGGIGVLLGWIAIPACITLSAAALGDVEETGSPSAEGHRYALFAAVFVLLGLAGGIVGRVAHTLRERRSIDKPSPPPWRSRWVLWQLGLAVVALLACWAVRDTALAGQGWIQDLAAFAAWLAVWSGAVTCLALALAAGEALRAGGDREQRRLPVALALAGCLSVLALPPVRSLAVAELEPYDQIVETARSEPGSSMASAPTFAVAFAGLGVGPARPGEDCARSFLLPAGSRRKAWSMNESIARRRGGDRLDVEQLLLDAVFATCRRSRADPAPYLTKVVKHMLIRDGQQPPEDDTCTIDSELPAGSVDPVLRIHSARCWKLLQQEACDDGDRMVAILFSRAGGATYPELASALQMGESAAKMSMKRFIDELPKEVREQCQ